jgi:hypothetical protein
LRERAEVGFGGWVETTLEGVETAQGAPEAQGSEYAEVDQAEREPGERDEHAVAEAFEGPGNGRVNGGEYPCEQSECGCGDRECRGPGTAAPEPEAGGDDECNCRLKTGAWHEADGLDQSLMKIRAMKKVEAEKQKGGRDELARLSF